MPAIEPLCHLLGITPGQLSKEEHLLLEAGLFASICEELKEIFRAPYKEYFRLMKFTVEKENIMLETNLVRLMVQDILSTNDYNLQGIAQYTDTPENIIQEVCSGRNTSPSAIFHRRVIDLHRNVRRDLYRAIMRKITAEYVTAA